MNHEFCMKCGHKQLFVAQKPKFCSACGSLFNPVSASVSEPEEELESSSSISHINLNSLKSSIKYETRGSALSLDSLWSDPLDGKQIVKRPVPNLGNSQEVLEQSIRECSSSKIPKSVNE